MMIHMNQWNDALIVLIIIISGALVVGKLTEKPRIPDVAAYLVLGIILGPSGLHWIYEPTTSEVNQFILTLGATLILFDGGRSVSFEILKKVWLSITLLSTLGVLVSALVVGVSAHLLLGTPWLFSLLLAAVLASTDPATLIPVFKRVPIQPRLQQTVESESAFNDATASVLVFTLLSMLQVGGNVRWIVPFETFFQSSLVGLTVGVIFGLFGLWLVSQNGWGVFSDYGSIVLFALAIGAYELAEFLHASGFMAAFTAGVLTGNGKSFGWAFRAHTEANIHHFGNAITMLMRMLIFVLLGTQVDFHMVIKYLIPGLLIVAVLMFVARPVTVLASVLPDGIAKWQWREIVFMFWVRETGVIPAALAGMIAASHLPGSDMVGAVTFLAILLTIIVQASTTGIVANRLGIAVAGEEEDI